MQYKYTVSKKEYSRMNTAEIRDTFLIDGLFEPNKLVLNYCEIERSVVGSAVPTDEVITLSTAEALAADYFCQRRELGVINLGGVGQVSVDGETFQLDRLDCLYVGRGAKSVSFSSEKTQDPAKFYLLSYPAHQFYPTKFVSKSMANPIQLGSLEDSNSRTIYQYIHPKGIESCQLVMGVTVLNEGSVWNTMPAHTHQRRTEVYLYFDVAPEHAVFHFMGTQDETRHIATADMQAVISPMWSIHSGCGTRSYSFCWGMGGENQQFDDMDHIAISDLR